MHKDKAEEHIKQNLSSNEDLVGFFQAINFPKLWLRLLLGPLMGFAMKQYFIAVTNKGIHFHMLNRLGKFSHHDFFFYNEIEKIKIKKGTLTLPLIFFFSNGTELKLKAQKKGLERVAKIDEKTLDYIKQHIKFF
jgi:hypothetical protein